ncbi:Hydroxyacylglutathione hydrolase [Thalassocella blandensis]|nr:Hydroxyacylglutathione hydrolase [Thalassocella blandensis]
MYKVHPIPALESNYIWTIEHEPSGDLLVIDPGESDPVLAYIREHQLNLNALLITHSHWDHVTGIEPIMEYYEHETSAIKPLSVYGPDVIPQVNQPLTEGDEYHFHSLCFTTWHTPGHLPEHLSYLTKIAGDPALFCGDTLFSAGCGRMFSGTPTQFQHSLQRFAELPADTKVYCTHEYTEANLKFALAVDPENAFMREYLHEVQAVRAQGSPSLPSFIGIEKKINPFLRTSDASIIAAARQRDAQIAADKPEEVFRVLRAWKDQFKG